MDLGLDGVSETKSSCASLDVYSARFLECRTIYPLTIIKAIEKDSLNQNEVLQSVLNETTTSHCLKTFIADNPKRSFIRQSLSHSAKYACEYCFSHGDPVKKFIRAPESSELGTLENILSETTNTESVQALTKALSLIHI